MTTINGKLRSYISTVNLISSFREGSSVDGQLSFYNDYLTENKHIKTIIEIGFNSGISAAGFLSVRDDIRVLSIDIGLHGHVIPCKRVIDAEFPGRHLLVIGDSTMAMPLLQEFFKVKEGHVDLIFVDGNHNHPGPLLDIVNSLKYCDENTIVMVDDVCPAHGSSGVIQAVNDLVHHNVMQPLQKLTAEDRGWVLFKRIFGDAKAN